MNIMIQTMINEMTRNKCQYMGCYHKRSIIGKCKHCDLTFCKEHRFTETHKCIKYNLDKSFEKFKNDLLAGKCNTNKITKIDDV